MSNNHVHPVFQKILEKASKRERRYPLLPPGECRACDDARARKDRMMPPHDPSPNCQSGKRPHCTCDACY